MEDIFIGDIFEKIEPPHGVSFKIVGTALPTNQDIYFVAKWHEIFERYTTARLFVRKALEDNWEYWFNRVDDEKIQHAIENKFKAELYETALLSYNILVDLTWAWTYVSAEYLFDPAAALSDLRLNSFTKKYIKNILARITGYIEEQTGVASNYCNYMNTQTKNPFEIEHIITDHYEWFTAEYSDQDDFRRWRNSIGALLLLHKSINASFLFTLKDLASARSSYLPFIKAFKVKNILRRLFGKGTRTKYKFVSLENANFYAFIINNVKQLKLDFKECAAQMGGIQMSMIFEPKTAVFSIPDMEVYKYSEVKQRQFMRLNAYLGYTNEFITDRTRSTPERLFEKYCETRADRIAWVYKNGDKGQQYLSIVYLDGFSKQWLFYPDYIVKTIDGQVWLIETKGGEVAGHSKNLDAQVSNKFIAFKQYAEKYKLNFGFVRDINEDLFINNTKYHEDMSHESWRPLSDLL